LLSDVDRSVGAQYGVVRDSDDKYADYPKRVSFLIDPNGVVVQVWDVDDVAQHAADVLRALRDASV
jgi:peroxiredoxin